MDMNKIAVFRMTTGKMGWLAERQRVLSQNVANSDTPKYQPKDLKAVDFKRLVQKSEGMQIARTHRDHRSLGSEGQKYQVEKSRDPYETAPDGNAVILEEQLIKAAKTTADYELMTSLYRKHVNMFKIALGRGQGQ
jgi:flagellar basal-body rod protein FlgB